MKEDRTGALELPTAEQLVASENAILNPRRIEIPAPPQELLDVQSILAEKGISIFEAHFLPNLILEQDSQLAGWQVKPEDWFWKNIKAGKISEDARKLSGMWVLIDGSQKPNYDEGKQMYANDPFTLILSDLRKEGKIEIPDFTKHVPQAAELLGIESERVRVPKEIEFNVIGNLHHPEWGQTNTWEWLHDKFEDVNRLVGGYSGYGGLALVNDLWPGRRNGPVGFRLLVEFPQK